MLSAKLSEDLDETMYDEDEKDMEETYMDEEKEDMDEMMYDEDEKDMEEVKHGDDDKMKEADLDEEIDLEEILNELELEEAEDSDKKVDEVKDKDDKDSMEEAKDDDKKMEEAKDDDDKKMEEVKDKDDKDSMEEAKDDEMKKEELDEMGRPIYKSEDANYAGYTADRVHEGDGEFDLDALLEEINNLDEKKDDDEVNESEDTVNETEETNEVVATGLAGIAGLVAAAGGMAKLKMMFQDPEVQKKFPRASKVLDALQSAGSAAGQAMRRENEEMAEELEETKKALETVRGELKANTLDESQKLRVVESLDKASSTKEAKLIYETIKDTFNISKNTKNSPKRKSIKENLGMASKATGTSTAPKKEVISESNDMVARFKKLANIKINE
jgi:hypothetical protein